MDPKFMMLRLDVQKVLSNLNRKRDDTDLNEHDNIDHGDQDNHDHSN